MSVYEKRFQVVYGPGGRFNAYEDDPRDVVRIDREYGGVARVLEGYADAEDVGPGHPSFRGIEGTVYTRRTEREVPREEWERLARERDVEEELVAQAVRERGPLSWQERQAVRELAVKLTAIAN